MSNGLFLLSLNEKDAAMLHSILTSDNPMARLHSLWILHQHGQLSNEQLLNALIDKVPQIRENALIIAEEYLSENVLLMACMERIMDSDQRVRMQAALTVSTISEEDFVTHRSILLSVLRGAAALDMDDWNIAAYTLAAKHDPEMLFRIIDPDNEHKQKLCISLGYLLLFGQYKTLLLHQQGLQYRLF